MSNISISEKRKQITEYLYKYLAMIEPEGKNVALYKKFLETMTNDEFSQFMENIKDKKFQIRIYMENMKSSFNMQNLLDTAKSLQMPIFERVIIKDDITGYKYLTNQKYMIIQLPIRRVVQYLAHKMSMPTSDTEVEALTGQVTGDSKAASITAVETQVLHSKGLDNVLIEFLKVRGGDVNAYQELKQQISETGEVSLEGLGQNTNVRSATVFSSYLKAMLLDNNYVE